MVEYVCFRCGYNGKQKINLIRHLNRKNVCKATEDDVEIEMIKDYYGFVDEKKTAPKQHLNSTQNAPFCTQTAPKQHPNAPFCENEDAPKMHLFAPFVPKKCTQMHPKCTQNEKKTHICNYCNKSFTRSTGLTKHLNICKKKREKDIETLAIMQNEEMIKIKKESENMKKEIEELKNFKIQTQNNTTNNNNNITTTNNINNSKNIYINNYGNEDLKHLRTRDFTKLFDGIYNAVPKLIEKIHFDPKHPENQNIKYTNQKSPYLKIVKSDKWQLVNKKHELLDLIDAKCFMLKEKYYSILEKKKYKITEAHRDKIEEFMEKYNEDDKKVMLDLIERTELMLLNNS